MVEITDANGLVVATVNKVIYIRPKRPSAAAKQWSQKTS
jgi:hypothetical protein